MKIGRRKDGRFVVLHAVAIRDRPAGVEDLILRTAQLDGRGVTIVVPQDPGQAGVSQVQDLVKKLAGFIVTSERPTGDKATQTSPSARSPKPVRRRSKTRS